MVTFDTILEQINAMHTSMLENRDLLNQIVAHVNEMDARLECVRQAQVAHGERLETLARAVERRRTMRPTLTPLPMETGSD